MTWMAAQLTDPSYSSSIPQIAAEWAAVKAVTDANGLNLVAYEGGQGFAQWFDPTGLTSDQVNQLDSFMTDFAYSPQMAGLYQTLWDDWAKVSNGPFMQFTDVSGPSQYGAWGLYRSLGDTNPNATLLTGLNDQQNAWFGDGGGTRYQQGVIKIAGDGGQTLSGTDKQDFLVGGNGNDTFIPGNGNDFINGGNGDDTIELPGKPSDYSVKEQGKRYLLTGLGASISFADIDAIRFGNGATLTPSALLAR